MLDSFNLIVRGVYAALILTVLIFTSSANSAEDAGISKHRQLELVKLVRNDCGSCHGLTLKGGLGPALLPVNLQEKAKEGLRETILHGRTGTAMPPWSAFLNELEANWIVEQLMKGFPNAD
jgi:cytochrome c55X